MRLPPALLSLSLGIAASASAQMQSQDATPAGDDPVLIFFAWDRPVIDGDAAARLDAVVASLKTLPGARVDVAGHADRSGPDDSNRRSGQRRAEAVADYLASRGVADATITVVSHGESRPLIPTADGVREPQNRRVEIFVRR